LKLRCEVMKSATRKPRTPQIIVSMHFFVPICSLTLSSASSWWTLHFAECWCSKMIQLSPPVTMVPNLFAAILSSNDSNSSHFWTLVARSCSVNWWEIHHKRKYLSWS
jgi:hypothetical protein